MSPQKNHFRSDSELLPMSNIDIEKTEWIERWNNDLVIVHNPCFKFRNHEPYRMDVITAILCDHGTASGIINLKPYRLQKNSFVVMLDGDIVEAGDQSEDFQATYIFMSEQFTSRLEIGDSYKFYESVSKEPCYRFDERGAESLRSYIKMARSILQMKDSNPNIGETLRLLIKLFFLMMGWYLHVESPTPKTNERTSMITQNFIALVKAHYREHRNVEFYSERMHMTAKYMSTIVKKISGKTALQWIEDYVILDAKAQLSSSMNSVQQICYNLNFPTQTFFGRYFKRAVGMSPSDYRRLAKSLNSNSANQT